MLCTSESNHPPHFHTPTPHRHHLPRPNSRTRRRITCRHRIINIDLNPLIRRTIRARKRHRGPRVPTPPILHLNLRTADIELRPAHTPGRVQRNMLNTHKILARRQGLGNRERDLCRAVVGERHLPAREGRALRVHFEPHGAGAVEGRGGLARGDFGHVELERARVRDGGHGGEADGVAGVDGVGLGCCAGGELVAPDLGRGDVGYGAVRLVVCCL